MEPTDSYTSLPFRDISYQYNWYRNCLPTLSCISTLQFYENFLYTTKINHFHCGTNKLPQYSCAFTRCNSFVMLILQRTASDFDLSRTADFNERYRLYRDHGVSCKFISSTAISQARLSLHYTFNLF